jgi:putative serine protease PepD
MSSTPEGPQDAAREPQPEGTDAAERAAHEPATEAVPTHDAAQDHPQDAPTQRIAPAATQQLPQTPADHTPQAPAAPPASAYPAPYQQQAPYQQAPQQQTPQGYPGAPDPRQQPRYGQYAPHQPGAQHPGPQQHPGQQGQQRPGDPLAAFRTPAPGAPGQPPTGGGEHPVGLGAAGVPDGHGGTTTRTRERSIWLPVVGVGVGAALLASLGTAALTGAFDEGTSRAADISTVGRSGTDTAPVSGSTAENPDWQAVASAVQASVVAIQVTTSSGGAEGSGVIVDTDGHIVTNNHVVSGAQDDKVQVTLTDGRIFTADVVGTDPTTDLAVIQITDAPDDLTPASLGDSTDVTVGDPVMAVGNPLGLANTVTTGIVSALDRPVSTTENGSNESVVTNAIQIDAAINPGNSGGPLFDAQGRVIGITSSIATTSSQSGSIGLGFAIPVNLADMVAQQLIADGTAEHAFLGVGLSDGTATADGVTRSGAQVESVTSGSPAAEAGVQKGDVIVAIDGKAVAGAESLTGYVRAQASGDQVALTLVRDGASQEVDVTLAVREETAADSGSGSGQGSTPSNPEDMTPEQLWEWFQQQQGGGR